MQNNLYKKSNKARNVKIINNDKYIYYFFLVMKL